MIKIRILGELGRRFGRVFELEVSSAREAVRAIAANISGFADYLIESEAKNIGYRVFVTGHDLALEELDLHISAPEIIIVPAVLAGGGRMGGLFQILAGGALLGIGLGFGFVPIALLGASLILQGIASLLTPTPENEGNENDYFSGTVNTIGQGAPVRIVYGRTMAGAQPIGASITLASETLVPLP